jgi:hypothetical protein
VTEQQDYDDGIYIAMAEDEYHAIERLSGSGMQKLRVGPANFWAESWLNPDREIFDPDDEDADPLEVKKELDSRVVGKAYHCARLEPDQFEARYARKPKRGDYPATQTCYTSRDIEAELVKLEQPKNKGREVVAEKAVRLKEAGYEGNIFPLIIAEFEEQLGDRIALKAKTYDSILVDMKRLHGHPEISELLEDGIAEITILWTCKRTGIKMKARLDYLKVTAWSDFKTFENWNGKQLDQKLADDFRYNRQFMQAINYRDAVEMMRSGALEIFGNPTEKQLAVIKGVMESPGELECYFIYQEKGGIPNILAKQVVFHDLPYDFETQTAGATEEQIAKAAEAQRSPTELLQKGQAEIGKAKADFLLYNEVYPAGVPWFPLRPRTKFSDADFNSFWLQERPGR